MCNLYSMTSNQRAILELTRTIHDRTGNLPSLPAISGQAPPDAPLKTPTRSLAFPE
jgi:hypothetical protein